MGQSDELRRENEELRGRLTRLSEASLRINDSLDLETVLQDVVDSAHILTGARYGTLNTVSDEGQHGELFVSGMTEAERQGVIETPGAIRYFEYCRDIPGPLRTADFRAHTASLGLTDFRPLPVGGFMAAPLRHRGESLGYINVGKERDGSEFTAEDEETLVMFASQAALVIANARRHRDERRARADLEALVNTAPVGVIVFEAESGSITSVNQETRRIVGEVQSSAEPVEKLLAVLSYRRADGREVAPFDIAQELIAGETVWGEEIVIEMPDGRSVSTLVNGTPIRAEDGTVESVVVTMQDMTPLEELERMRAEFLAMVSHELRTPLTSIRGSATALLDDASSLHPGETRQFHRIILDQADRMRGMIGDLLDVARIETGALSVSLEPTDIIVLMDEARKIFMSGGNKQNLKVDIPLDLPWVMADRSRVVQVLGNLLTNAARHSSDSSSIRVTAVREGVHVTVSVSDEGRGIPAESMPSLFRKFSRLTAEDQGGDTGLGLAVCKGIVEAHGGRIWAESDGPGLGARFTFTIPTATEAGTGSDWAPVPSRRPKGKRERILAVDDDPQALKYVRDALSKEGYDPILTGDPQEALGLVEANDPHLVLLDLVMPETNGIDLMQEMFEITDVPIIFISAYGQEENVAKAFEMGADDYVVKPFSPTELVARIKAALRKRDAPEWAEPTEPYQLDDLTINYYERRVTLAGQMVQLTPLEYALLVELSANAGRVLTYERLLQRVWGQRRSRDSRPVRTTMKNLRRKLGDDADNPTYIFTEPRIGYVMAQRERSET